MDDLNFENEEEATWICAMVFSLLDDEVGEKAAGALIGSVLQTKRMLPPGTGAKVFRMSSEHGLRAALAGIVVSARIATKK